MIDVCLRREDAELPPEPCVVAVIDVLRATSTIVAALASGARSVEPVDAVEHAEAARRADPGCLLAGERDLRAPPGFDFGNSPGSFQTPSVRGRRIVLATTNGTRALAWAKAAGAGAVAVALLNLGAVAAWLSRACPAHVLILCAGVQGAIGWDDAYVAGALVDRLASAPGDGSVGLGPPACRTEAPPLTDTARAVRRLYLGAQLEAGGQAHLALAATAPGRRLAGAGLASDVAFCAEVDALPVVPVLRGGRLVLQGQGPAAPAS